MEHAYRCECRCECHHPVKFRPLRNSHAEFQRPRPKTVYGDPHGDQFVGPWSFRFLIWITSVRLGYSVIKKKPHFFSILEISTIDVSRKCSNKSVNNLTKNFSIVLAYQNVHVGICHFYRLLNIKILFTIPFQIYACSA